MKENKKWHGLNNKTAEQGYTEPSNDIPRSDYPLNNVTAELDSLDKPEGFLERQNVFYRS